MRFKLSEKQKDFIKENYTKMSRNNMAKKLKLKSVQSINTYMKKNNLSVSKEQTDLFKSQALKGRTTFTSSEDAYITKHYLTKEVKVIAAKLNRSYCGVSGRLKELSLTIPTKIIEERKRKSQFQSGQIPFNKGKKQKEYMSAAAIKKTKKTRFKKGELPHNYKGGEFLSKDGFVIKSLGESKKAFKHHLEWEKLHGKIPDKHILKCKSQDKTNTDPSNWELMSMTENMLRNSNHNFPEELIKPMTLRCQLNKKIQLYENN